LYFELESLKAAQEVGFQVVKVFKAYSHANQALLDTSHLSLRLGEAAMRGAGGVGHQRFNIA
jgi:hypothetical protein